MSPELDAAIRRLGAAIGVLETAIAARGGAGHSHADLATELQLMQDDRARLALDLESATARLNQVEAVTEHVGRRVQAAIGHVGGVLARAEAGSQARS